MSRAWFYVGLVVAKGSISWPFDASQKRQRGVVVPILLFEPPAWMYVRSQPMKIFGRDYYLRIMCICWTRVRYVQKNGILHRYLLSDIMAIGSLPVLLCCCCTSSRTGCYMCTTLYLLLLQPPLTSSRPDGYQNALTTYVHGPAEVAP